MSVMAAISRSKFHSAGRRQVTTIAMSGSLLANWDDAMIPGAITNASGVAPATRQINMVADTLQ
jgi:hypothetical protein